MVAGEKSPNLVRYIHRNPIKAGLTDQLDRYVWSSHMGYISKAEKWNWLHKNFVLSMLSKIKDDRLEIYRQFVAAEDEEDIGKVFKKKKLRI